MAPPDPHSAGDISGGDPLTIGGESRNSSLVSVLPIDGSLERGAETADDDGAAVAVDDGVGFGIAGDEDPSAPLSGGDAGVGLQ